jgi:hyperosmotically inducible periplasmic protein
MTPKLLLVSCLVSLAASACAGGGQAVRANPNSGAMSGGVMDDATITARVKTVLLNDPQVAATKVDVATAGGIVTLSGSVRSKTEEARAISLARQVTGVRDVKSTLLVPPTSQF